MSAYDDITERYSFSLYDRSVAWLEGRAPQIVIKELAIGRRNYLAEVISYKTNAMVMVF